MKAVPIGRDQHGDESTEAAYRKSFVDVMSQPKLNRHIPTAHGAPSGRLHLYPCDEGGLECGKGKRTTLYDETRNDLPANYARRNRGKLDYRLGELVSDPAGEN